MNGSPAENSIISLRPEDLFTRKAPTIRGKDPQELYDPSERLRKHLWSIGDKKNHPLSFSSSSILFHPVATDIREGLSTTL